MGAKKRGKSTEKLKDDNQTAKNKARNIARDARVKAKHAAKKLRRAAEVPPKC